MKKILVTGGAGFIGYNTAKALLNRGDKVVIVDNFNDYYDSQLKKDRADNLIELYPEVKIFKVDISDYENLKRIFEFYKFDQVCHLAAQAGVRYSLTNPFVYINSNIVGTLNLLELCRHYNVRDFVFASSSSVYGDNKKIPFSEEDRVDHPISLYAATKKSNEEMAYTYHHLFGLNCTGLRFFTVYGPWGRPDMSFFKFTKNITEQKSIDVYNYGEMSRDFTYIDDIVAGVVASLDRCGGYNVFNLARGESVNLIHYINEIERNLGIVAEQNLMPLQAGDIPVTSADISRAKMMLGYNPKVSVKEGIKNFIDWYKQYYNV